MNRIIKLSLLVLIAFSYWACQDDDEINTVQSGTAAVLETPVIQDSLILDAGFASNSALTLVWSEADYGSPTEVNYEIQAASSIDFDNPVSAGTTNSRSFTWTVSSLNAVVGGAGLTPFERGTIFLRILSSVGTDNLNEQISNVISFDVFPYTTEKPRLFVVGDYQGTSGYGANPEDAPQLASSEFGVETNYEGYVYFNAAGDFQLHRAGFSGEYVNGNPVYGESGGNAVEGTTGSFNITEAGYYLIKVDLESGSISMQNTQWGVPGPGGPAGGWPDSPPDFDLEYDVEEQVWKGTGNATDGGEFKFRANDDWGLNYGEDGDSDGSLDLDGGNLRADRSGNATFILDLSNPRAYTYRLE